MIQPSGRVALDVSAVPANLTGVGRYAVGLLSEAVKIAPEAGLEIVALAKRGDSGRFQHLCPGLEVSARVPAPRLARIAYERVAMAGLARHEGASLYHGIHYTLPVRMSLKSVATIHDLTFLEHPEWHERSKVLFFRRMIASSAARADALVFPSRSTLEAFRRHFDTQARTEVIPLGVSASRFATYGTKSDEELLGALGVKSPFLLFCGTLEPRKNLERLLAAFESLDAPGVELVVAGLSGWRDSALRTKLERLVGKGRVRLAGFVSDAQLGALYRGAVATLYPSLEEGFGLPGLEAMSQGSLLITSARSAMVEYARDDCVLVEPTETASITRAMEVALAGGDELLRKAEAGRERASEMSWEACARSHVRLYRSILGL